MAVNNLTQLCDEQVKRKEKSLKMPCRGLSPEHLQGRFVGVYIGSSYAESERTRCYTDFKNGNGVLGGSRALFANRISYFLDLKGPSLSLDQACCSSALALEHACKALRSGEVEAAIVGGFNLCLHPQAMIHYGRVIKLSEDNATRSFDACADGCVSSDAISVLFLQKAKDALSYALP
ncbi:fatty acid synthase-like [Battus philenor]|uniref:fatty acid synthase-like n=1 Tax=Battus philenor TaxID=42288 RepID=UPI0035CF6743